MFNDYLKQIVDKYKTGDVRHFIKVCDVLVETIKLQEETDKLTKKWI